MRAHSLFVATPDRLAPPHIQLDGLETAFTNPQVITNTMVNTELIVWLHKHRARRPAENSRPGPSSNTRTSTELRDQDNPLSAKVQWP